MRARTSASQVWESPSLSLQVTISVAMTAARSRLRGRSRRTTRSPSQRKTEQGAFGGIVGQVDPAISDEAGKAVPVLV